VAVLRDARFAGFSGRGRMEDRVIADLTAA
jgi:hypothetical protein